MLLCVHVAWRKIFKRKHKEGSIGKQICTCQFTVPELKVVIVLFYYLLLTIVLWTSLSSIGDRFYEDLRRFTDCMAEGNCKDHDCRELREDLEANAISILEVTSLIILAFQNFASLPFVIQFQTMKKSITQVFSKSITSS